MTWSLIQALTGIQTGDDFNSHNFGYTNVIAVKTHYPVKTARNSFDVIDASFNRAIVLLRNPLYAIPSYYNLLYERQHHLPNHSTRGSNEEWIQYRDHGNHGFMYQIELFVKFVEYWLLRFQENRGEMLLVTYEELIGDAGPVVAGRIVEFLSRGNDGVDVDLTRVECIWRSVVRYKDAHTQQSSLEASGRRTTAKHNSFREGPKERPYQNEHLEHLLGVLHGLREVHSYDEEFVTVMNGYIDIVSNTAPVE